MQGKVCTICRSSSYCLSTAASTIRQLATEVLFTTLFLTHVHGIEVDITTHDGFTDPFMTLKSCHRSLIAARAERVGGGDGNVRPV